MKPVNIPLLIAAIAAISALDADYDRFDEHRQVQAATRERRSDFDSALGDHPRKAELLGQVQKGDASQVLGIAREILAQVQDSPGTAAAS